MSYLVVKWLHILSSTLLFGTGLGSAFYLYVASRTRDPHVIAAVVKNVVIADWVFTTPSVVLQPLTGFYLLSVAGYPLDSTWILWSLGLYLLAGAAWLPVVWMQLRMRDMARQAVAREEALPSRYWRYLRIWTWLGVVAFLSVVVVFYLMVAKPA